MKIAIIGSGISGLSAGYFLKNEHDVTIFEKDNRFGGHANTSTINYNGTKINVDTGFIVFNYQTYYHLQRLFNALAVDVCKSKMSFGVSNQEIEYSSSSPLPSFFPNFENKKKILNPHTFIKHIKMLFEIIKFNKIAKKTQPEPSTTLENYLNKFKFSEFFKRNYIYAMTGAIWSCSIEESKQYPAQSFINFFKHHGLLQITNHPQWYCIKGGSKEYVRKITSIPDLTFKNIPVTSVTKHNNKVLITHQNGNEEFDKVIIATHANEAYTITGEEILKNFQYSQNTAILHNYSNLMPKNKKKWSSWNYTSDKSNNLCLTYWMNNLQPIPNQYPTFVTLNPNQPIPPENIFYQTTYSHPIFNFKSQQIQQEISSIQGKNGIYYIGSYLTYGFHEDGILSSYNICQKLVSQMPW